jgi:hypothetical protein
VFLFLKHKRIEKVQNPSNSVLVTVSNEKSKLGGSLRRKCRGGHLELGRRYIRIDTKYI